jgi:hypothetical protein
MKVKLFIADLLDEPGWDWYYLLNPLTWVALAVRLIELMFYIAIICIATIPFVIALPYLIMRKRKTNIPLTHGWWI